jgi:RNA polymerase sigma-70 factor (sigma-E family)
MNCRARRVRAAARVLPRLLPGSLNLNGVHRHPRSVSSAPDFDELFAAAWPRLLRTTYGVTQDAQLAEDVLQAAFVKTYASWARVSRANDPFAYVRKIAVNTALAQHRKAYRRRETTFASLPDRASPAGPVVDDEVWAAIGALPPRQRAVVVLRYYEDLSEREIAAVLGIRPGTVKSHAAAALETLRHALEAPTRQGGTP